jgi:asparagine synthase (glutamine-hydrolysing)
MCGIFVYVGDQKKPISDTLKEFHKLKHRGPDASNLKRLENGVIFGFHRLAIMDTTDAGMQPMSHQKYPHVTFICNGMIYNWKELAKEYKFDYLSNCDCEAIIHMYVKFGFQEMLKRLDGYFTISLYDSKTKKLYVGRDFYGVKSLYIGRNTSEIYIASELKAITDVTDIAEPFPPGHYMCLTFNSEGKYSEPEMMQYYNLDTLVPRYNNAEEICKNIRVLLTKAVYKRLQSNREICGLLSGGVDSSLVCALAQKILINKSKKRSEKKEKNDKWKPPAITHTSSEDTFKKLLDDSNKWKDRVLGKQFRRSTSEQAEDKDYSALKTFSIGMKNSTDLEYAKKVAEWIGSDHREITIDQETLLDLLEGIVVCIESYDVTSVRASAAQYLVGSAIEKTTDCKVVLNGDGSDEIMASYKYCKNAPNNESLHAENIKLLKNISYFDVLRVDKCISANGLDARCPYLDREYVEYCMQIMPELKRSDTKIEKYLLREAFNGTGILPDEVLWRKKEALSDGISSESNSWHKILADFFDKKISDEEFEQQKGNYTHVPPKTKEALYYRQVFEKYYPNKSNVVPYQWLPNWSTVVDPSARLI